MSLPYPHTLVTEHSGNESPKEDCEIAPTEGSLSVVEITGLELLGFSEHSDDSDFSFDSYAQDSFDHAYHHTMARQTGKQPNSTNLRIQPIRRPSKQSSKVDESEEYSLGYESTEIGSYAADSVEGLRFQSKCVERMSNRRRASMDSRNTADSSREHRASRRSSLDSYAMDSVQLKRDLPRRFANFTDFANDSFDVARHRPGRTPTATPPSSLFQNFNNDLSSIKRRISLDSTYNFSQGVYDTQSINGGAGRAA